MNRVWKLFFVLASVTLAACNDSDTSGPNGMNPESIYLDYSIMGEEDKFVSCVFRYKLGSPDGIPLVLKEPSKVELDGKKLVADSSRYDGAYYEMTTSIDSFSGKHSVVFTGSNKKKFVEEFEFIPFKTLAGFPEKLNRTSFSIQLDNMPSGTVEMEIVMIDTSYVSEDVNETVSVVNGLLTINEEMLNRLTNGLISMEIIRQEERELKQKTKKGGRISMRYAIKREFELID